MAEAFLNQLGGGNFNAESAGLEPGNLNPVVVEAMKEMGIDISQNKTKSVFDFFKQGKNYHYVITVCDEAAAEKCPIFPGIAKKLHWSFKDPSAIDGPFEEKLKTTSLIRDQIKKKIENFISEMEINQ